MHIDKEWWQSKLTDQGIGVLLSYLTSLGADATSFLLFGGKGDKTDTLKQVLDLINEGKQDEALKIASTLSSDVLGFGQKDEEKLSQDLMEVYRLELAPPDKVVAMIN